jgi:hypothetical protein
MANNAASSNQQGPTANYDTLWMLPMSTGKSIK